MSYSDWLTILLGSCADLMHSAKQFNAGFKESVIAIILRDIVKGLHYLHSLGYIHRYCIYIYCI